MTHMGVTFIRKQTARV